MKNSHLFHIGLLFLFINITLGQDKTFIFFKSPQKLNFTKSDGFLFSYFDQGVYKTLMVTQEGKLSPSLVEWVVWKKHSRDLNKLETPNVKLMMNSDSFSHHQVLQTDRAYKSLSGKIRKDIIVAVPDLGVDIHHKLLKGRIHTNRREIPNNKIDDDQNGLVDDVHGWNFCENNGDVFPDRYYDHHGTHIAGILAANKTNTDLAVYGVSPNIKVLPILWYQDYCRWNEEMVVRSFIYAADQGAQFINSSYNIDGKVDADIFKEVISYLNYKGVIIVNSAGNNKEKDPPRLLNTDVLFVSSINKLFNRSKFSNYGFGVDFNTPAEKVSSLGLNNKIISMSGTSMAVPMVIGVLANLKQYYGFSNNYQLLSLAMRSSKVSDPRIMVGTGTVKFENNINCESYPFKISSNLERIIERRSRLRKVKTLSWRVNGLIKNTLMELEDMFTISPAVDFYLDYDRGIGNNLIKIQFYDELPRGSYQIKIDTSHIIDYLGCPLYTDKTLKIKNETIKVR